MTNQKPIAKTPSNPKATKATSPQSPSAEQKWLDTIAAFPEANFLQSPEYGKMNELLGEKVITEEFGKTGRAQMIVRDAKRGRYLGIPCGPLIDWSDKGVAKDTLKRIAAIAKAEKCVFVRIRPQLLASRENLQLLADLGLKKSPMHLAAEHTVMIDLSKTEDELLAAMRRQTRYDVRRATKLGITVRRDNSEAIFKEFHEIQLATARRQGFVPPNLKTLLAEREAFLGHIWIYIAETTASACTNSATQSTKQSSTDPENPPQPIAYGLIIANGKEGDYYEAASTPLNRKLPGAHALLWKAMKDLKNEGYERFNLWGIAPAGQPNHRYAGVTTFKTGFGGDIVEYVPAHDLVISQVGYLKDLIVEKARKKRRHL